MRAPTDMEMVVMEAILNAPLHHSGYPDPIAQARAAIRAQYEPDEIMLLAGGSIDLEDYSVGHDLARKVWHAMINAASPEDPK